MIPKVTIDKWRDNTNWPLDGQVEQDLVISRALVEIFNHETLREQIAFRGGTALHKLVLPKALRYSEDIDLNRLEKGPAKKVIDNVRDALDEMLGQPAKVKSTQNSVKIIYDYDSIDGATSRLKIEINTRETLPQEPLLELPFDVESDYFKGTAIIMTFNIEEMIGTKIRALYQRNKGRDLFDLYELGKLSFDWNKILASFRKLKIGASRLNFENNLDEKMKDAEFLEDIIPLLPSDISYDPKQAYEWFKKEVLSKM